MKTIQSTQNITVKVSEDDLIEKRWIPFTILSKKLADIEKENNMGYKSLRIDLYNSSAGKKYNQKIIAGIKCIDTKEPMTGKASLELTFERV